MPRKGGLGGKGLSALIPDIEISTEQTGVIELETDFIAPNKEQPRKDFDKEKLEALAESIKEHGIIQPLVVIKENDYYKIVAGERRWRAAKMLRLKKVPVIIKDYDSLQVEEIALVENLQRENLNPIEEAKGFKKLMDMYGLTQEQVGQKIGKSRPQITNTLRLLTLPAEVVKLIEESRLSTGHAKVLAGLTDSKEIIRIAYLAVNSDLSVRQIELIAKNGKKKPQKSKQLDKDVENAITASKDQLRKKYGVNIKMKYSDKYKGKIEIPFSDLAQLTKLIDLLEK